MIEIPSGIASSGCSGTLSAGGCDESVLRGVLLREFVTYRRMLRNYWRCIHWHPGCASLGTRPPSTSRVVTVSLPLMWGNHFILRRGRFPCSNHVGPTTVSSRPGSFRCSRLQRGIVITPVYRPQRFGLRRFFFCLSEHNAAICRMRERGNSGIC